MPDKLFRKLAGALSGKTFYLTGSYDDYSEDDYGFVEVENSRTNYVVSSPEHGTIMSVSYRHDAVIVVDAFENIIDGIVMETIETNTTKKEWIEPKGNTAVVIGEFDGLNRYLNSYGQNELIYENGVTMEIRVMNTYGGLKLVFVVKWNCETIQRKEAIEENMVDMVMSDMGKIQSTFEGRLKLKKFGYDVEDVEIECHFDAKTESRSECTPDIIKQVREARKGIGVN